MTFLSHHYFYKSLKNHLKSAKKVFKDFLIFFLTIIRMKEWRWQKALKINLNRILGAVKALSDSEN